MNKVEKELLDTERFGAWCRSDPLAAAILLEPQVATQVKEVYVTVELHGTNIRGAMVVDHLHKLGRQPNVTVLERVNTDLYQKLLLEAFAPDMIRSWTVIQLHIKSVTVLANPQDRGSSPQNITKSTAHFYFSTQII